MQRLAFLLALLVPVAVFAAATPWPFQLVQTYTAAVSDSDPNVAAPAAANQFVVPPNCSSHRGHVHPCTGYLLKLSDPAGTLESLSCTVTPWTYDSTEGDWASGTAIAGVGVEELYVDDTAGQETLFFQLSCSGDTVDSTNNLLLYAKGI